MSLAVLATKEGMTQMFLEDGVRVPVTVMRVEPNVVVQKKTVEKDGYNALQLGYGDIREKLVTKPEAGHMKKAGVDMKRYLRMRPKKSWPKEVGQSITAKPQSLNLDIAGEQRPRFRRCDEASQHERLSRHARYPRVLPSRGFHRLSCQAR